MAQRFKGTLLFAEGWNSVHIIHVTWLINIHKSSFRGSITFSLHSPDSPLPLSLDIFFFQNPANPPLNFMSVFNKTPSLTSVAALNIGVWGRFTEVKYRLLILPVLKSEFPSFSGH